MSADTMFEEYANRGGDLGIIRYEIEDTLIRVEFRGGKVYTYSHRSAGADKVFEMQRLARLGIGLNAFIMTHARNLYD